MKLVQPHPSALSRRQFLALSGVVPAAALAVTRLPIHALAAPLPGATRRPIGIELYSVRTELSRDLPTTLKTVAKIGYEAVEFYSPYFNWSLPFAKEVRTLLDDLGLKCLSTHNGFQSLTAGDTMTKAIELNQILGARQIILASAPGGTQGIEGWKRLCERLTAATNELKPHGLTTGYHNHGSEWKPVDGGQRIMDVIAANTPREFVLQLDVGTCVESGADPVAWVQANPGRIKCVHLKDWAPEGNAGDKDKGYRVLFGEGVTPWKALVEALESVGGVEFYLLEQEGSRFSEFETARRCLDSWKAFRRAG